MLQSLRVDLSFPEGNLYYRAGKLRAFLVELSKCDVKDNLLVLPEEKCPVFKFGQQSFIVIRDCYLRLFEQIVNRVHLLRVALSGTPGIGKTSFLIYFLWRLLRSEIQSYNKYPRILFHDKKSDRFVLHEDGSVYPLVDQPGYAGDQEKHPNMWYLVDSVAPELTRYLNILLVTSPNENLIKDHNKDAIPFCTLYMPLWDENEIEALITLKGGDSKVIRENQKKFGNIPRSLFTSQGDSLSGLENAWENAVGGVTRQALFNVLSGSEKDAKIFHHVIHVEVPNWRNVDSVTENDFTATRLKFASQMTQDAIIRNLCDVRSRELESLLEEAATTSIASSLCGSIFEAYVFRIMQDYSTYPWRARMLASDEKNCPKAMSYDPVDEFRPCCGINLNYKEFDNGSGIDFSSISKNSLFKARRKNYLEIDGFCADGIFNMTVGSDHEIILKDELIGWIEEGLKKDWFQVHDSSRNRKAIRFFFFVPWYAFNSWKKMQPIKLGSHTYTDRTQLRSLSFELCQIAVEIPRPRSLC
jgi:hypothetical protein